MAKYGSFKYGSGQTYGTVAPIIKYGTAVIIQPSSVSGLGIKRTTTPNHIVQPNIIISGGIKRGQSIISVNLNGTVSISGVKLLIKYGIVDIIQDTGIVILGDKTSSKIAIISGESNIVLGGFKSGKDISSISQSSFVTTEYSSIKRTGVSNFTASSVVTLGLKTISKGLTRFISVNQDIKTNKYVTGSLIVLSPSTVNVLSNTSKNGSVYITQNIIGATSTNKQSIGDILVTQQYDSLVSTTSSRVTEVEVTQNQSVSTTVNKEVRRSILIETPTNHLCVGHKVLYLQININQESVVTVTPYIELNDLSPEPDIVEYVLDMYYDEYSVDIDCVDYLLTLYVVDYPVTISTIEYVMEMEVVGVPYIGATVKLNVEFPVDAGNLSLLTDVKCVITDGKRDVIATITNVQPGTESGKYWVYYTIPNNGIGDLSYAWSGKIGDNLILLARKPMNRIWQ